MKYPEGAVVTRNQTYSFNLWPLETSYLGWYDVETNYDWWYENIFCGVCVWYMFMNVYIGYLRHQGMTEEIQQ